MTVTADSKSEGVARVVRLQDAIEIAALARVLSQSDEPVRWVKVSGVDCIDTATASAVTVTNVMR